MPYNGDYMSKKKILTIITQGSPWGGAQRYVKQLAAAAQKQGFEMTVATGEQKQNQLSEQLPKGVHRLHLSHLRRAIHPIHDILALFEIRRKIKELAPDVVHLHSSKAGALGSVAAIGLRKKPLIIYTVHGWVFLEDINLLTKLLYRFVEKTTSGAKDIVITLSDYERKVGARLGIPERKMRTIPIGIAQTQKHKTREQVRKSLDINKETSAVAVVANLYKNKGVDFLVEALAPLFKKEPHLHVYIFGDGPERARLERLAKTNSCAENIHFLGFVEHATTLLKGFDMFLLPSRKEGLPYALLEAMHAELPVIATKVGGVPDVITNNKNGLLIDFGDRPALRNATTTLLKEQKTSSALAKAAKKTASSLDEAVSIADVLAQY